MQNVVAQLPLEALPQGHTGGQQRPRERLPRRIPRRLFLDEADPRALRTVRGALARAAGGLTPHGCRGLQSDSRGEDVMTVEVDGESRRAYACGRIRSRDGRQEGAGRRNRQASYVMQDDFVAANRDRLRNEADRWWHQRRRQG